MNEAVGACEGEICHSWALNTDQSEELAGPGVPAFNFRQLWWHASLLKKVLICFWVLFGVMRRWVMGLEFSVNYDVVWASAWFIGINETLNVKDKK
jgi:hypothetical protein